MRNILATFSLIFSVMTAAAWAQSASPTLTKTKEQGYVNCGVNTALAGFSIADSQGRWTGIDVEYCRALAAAIFDDPEKVRFKPLGAQQRFTALQSGEVDVLSRNTTWTFSRDVTLGISFVGVTLYDGQGFIVPKALGVQKLADLDGAAICVQSGTTTELNLTDYFRAKGMSFTPVVFEGFDESTAAFFAGRCDAYTTDISALAVIRTTHTTKANDYVILSEAISKEPFGPAVRQDDAVWFALNRWVLFALIEAEEQGLSRDTVAKVRASTGNPALRRLLGVEPGLGAGLGLTDDWAYRVIRHMGHYGEVFERTLGKNSPLQLDRGFNQGLNKLWRDGGLHYSPPLR